MPYGIASGTMPAALAPWAWHARGDRARVPLAVAHLELQPTLASATFMVAAVTTKPGMCASSGM